MLKQVVWTHFEPVLPRFGPRKIPKCLEKGLVSTPKMAQNWVKNAPFARTLQPCGGAT